MLSLGWVKIVMSTQPGLGLDDGYIHAVYARNLLSGHFFQFNIGETSSGSTSPLWVVLVAMLGAVSGLMRSVWILSAICFMLSAMSAALLAREIILAVLGKSRGNDELKRSIEDISVFAGILIALYGRFFWHAFSGMETQLYSAAVTLVMALFLWENRTGQNFWRSSLLCAICLWIRPESFLLVIVMALGYIIANIGKTRRAITPILIMSASVLLYFLFNLLLTGNILPNTFFSKSALYRGTRWDYIAYTISTFWSDNFVLLLLALWGSIALVYFSVRARKYYISLPILWFLGLPFAKFAVSPQEAHFGRYTAIIIPTLTALASWWLVKIASLPRKLYLYLCVTAILLPSIVILPRWLDMPARTVEQINTIQGEVAKWVNENTDDGAVVATHDVGRIKYDTNREILDLAGLTSNEPTELIWRRRKVLPHSFIAFDSIAAELLLRHHPDVIAISPVWFPYLSANRDALELLWRTHQYTDAVECVPEMAIYRMKSGADSTIFHFEKYGFHPDKQWTLGIFVPQASQILHSLKSMVPEEKQKYIEFVKEQNKKMFPYLRISIRNILGDLLGWGEYQKAFIVAAMGCELYPDDAVLWNVQGAVLSQLSNFDGAAKAFSKCVELAPKNVNYRMNYAITLMNTGKDELARGQIDTVLALDPGNSRAREILSNIERGWK